MPMLSARHLLQFHRSKLLCGMYGFMAKLSVSRLNIYQILMRYLLNFRTSIYSTSSSDQEGSGVVISTLETVPRARQQQSLGEIEMISSIANGQQENQRRQPEEGSSSSSRDFSNSSQN